MKQRYARCGSLDCSIVEQPVAHLEALVVLNLILRPLGFGYVLVQRRARIEDLSRMMRDWNISSSRH